MSRSRVACAKRFIGSLICLIAWANLAVADTWVTRRVATTGSAGPMRLTRNELTGQPSMGLGLDGEIHAGVRTAPFQWSFTASGLNSSFDDVAVDTLDAIRVVTRAALDNLVVADYDPPGTWPTSIAASGQDPRVSVNPVNNRNLVMFHKLDTGPPSRFRVAIAVEQSAGGWQEFLVEPSAVRLDQGQQDMSVWRNGNWQVVYEYIETPFRILRMAYYDALVDQFLGTDVAISEGFGSASLRRVSDGNLLLGYSAEVDKRFALIAYNPVDYFWSSSLVDSIDIPGVINSVDIAGTVGLKEYVAYSKNQATTESQVVCVGHRVRPEVGDNRPFTLDTLITYGMLDEGDVVGTVNIVLDEGESPVVCTHIISKTGPSYVLESVLAEDIAPTAVSDASPTSAIALRQSVVRQGGVVELSSGIAIEAVRCFDIQGRETDAPIRIEAGKLKAFVTSQGDVGVRFLRVRTGDGAWHSARFVVVGR